MRKMKLAALGLSLAMLLAFSACSKKEEETTAAPVTEAVTEATEAADTEESAEAGEGTADAEESAETRDTEETSEAGGAGADKEETYVDDGKKTGRYNLFAIGEEGEYFDAKELMGDGAYLEILEDGKGTICFDENPDEFTWEERDGRLLFTSEGEAVECTIEKGIAFLALDEGAGMYFAKPGADTSVVKVKGLEELLGEMLAEELESMEAEEEKKAEKKAE